MCLLTLPKSRWKILGMMKKAALLRGDSLQLKAAAVIACLAREGDTIQMEWLSTREELLQQE